MLGILVVSQMRYGTCLQRLQTANCSCLRVVGKGRAPGLGTVTCSRTRTRSFQDAYMQSLPPISTPNEALSWTVNQRLIEASFLQCMSKSVSIMARLSAVSWVFFSRCLFFTAEQKGRAKCTFSETPPSGACHGAPQPSNRHFEPQNNIQKVG